MPKQVSKMIARIANKTIGLIGANTDIIDKIRSDLVFILIYNVPS
jgi:hypothetical protein